MAESQKIRKRRLSYSDLSLDDLKRSFGLSLDTLDLFGKIAPVEPDDWLTETLRKGQTLAPVSEKARAEFIIAPILLFIRDLLHESITLYSGVRFDVAPEKGLKGVCDFIIAKSPPLPTIQAPVLVMVEAKKNDIEEGLGQCAAEMVAAQIFNQRERQDARTIYGCVTTGETWQFLQLEGARLTIDKARYFIVNVEKILGILFHILSS